jgi:DNA-binding transcriptional LysR family regulator
MDRLAAMGTFARVVYARSFSAAAKHLNIGEPAVFKSIAQRERQLGVRLLLRSSRGLAPTEAGISYCERARRAVEEADEADVAVTFGVLHLVPRLHFISRPIPISRSISSWTTDRSL